MIISIFAVVVMAPGVTELEKWSLGRGWVSSRTLQPQARAGGSSSSAIVLTAAVGQGPSLQDSGQTIGLWKPSPPGVSGCYSHRQGRRRNSISDSPNKKNPNYDPVREKRWCNYFSVDVKSLVKSLLLLCWDSVSFSIQELLIDSKQLLATCFQLPWPRSST